ncbi:MAG: MFS transporter [Desulfobacterales bacterium]|nr:MFS transporter [Desulfobacterales bacterium]
MTREERIILCIVCLGALLFFNSLGSINVALPGIQREFGVSLSVVQWVSVMGAVMIATLSLCFGRAGDIMGRRKLYLAGIVLYGLGSGLGALSGSMTQLLVFRGVMTFGLAMAMPLSGAILATNFAPQRRGRALGWFASACAIGRATGPAVGGLILYLYTWRAIFIMNLMVGIVVSAAVFVVLKGEEKTYPEPFDFFGSAALLAAFPSLLIGLSLGARTQWAAPQIPYWFAAAAVGGAGFVWIEFHTRNPLIGPFFFRSLPFSGALLSIVAFSVMQTPVNIFGPIYMDNVLNFSPVLVGLVMTALPVFTALSSPFSGRLADQFDARYVSVLGLVFLVAGIWLYSLLGSGSHYLRVAAALALNGAGVGFFMPANQRTAFEAVGQEHYGIVSAMLASFNVGAGTLGVSVMVALMEHLLGGGGFGNPAAFAAAQQFSFRTFLPLAGVTMGMLLLGDIRKLRKIIRS